MARLVPSTPPGLQRDLRYNTINSPMNNLKSRLAKFAAAGALVATAIAVQAQPYYIVGDVINGWADPGAVLMNGGPTTYDYTVTGGTAGNYQQLKVTDGTWGTTWPGNNLVVKLDGSGGNTIYFYPGVFTDGWQPVQNRVGFVDPLNDTFEIAGDFTTPNWESDPAAQLVAAADGVYTNTYVIATAGIHNFKFRSTGTWNGLNVGADFGGANNATVTTTEPDQPVFFQLDLPNGRWLAGAPVVPVTNQVVFAVDMTVEIGLNRFVPDTDQVFVSGSFNGWPGTGPGALVLTNFPTLDGNTNLYYGTNTFIGAPSTSYEYKFTSSNPGLSGSGGYEPRGNNRTLTTLAASGLLILPTAVFGDAALADYLNQDVAVTFTIDMTGAMTSTNSPSAQNAPPGYTAHAFDPDLDTLVINGNFLSGGWISTWNPISLFGNIVTNNPVGSSTYTFTYTVPKGSPVEIHYKYGIIYGDNTSTNYVVDNEAASFQDHVRVIRATGTGAYDLPQDTFGNQYVEPNFGGLTLVPAPGGQVTLKWLGRPGVHVQSAPSVTGGSWVDHIETDGTNWSAGTISPDGLLSNTNLPATGASQYFRLVKP